MKYLLAFYCYQNNIILFNENINPNILTLSLVDKYNNSKYNTPYHTQYIDSDIDTRKKELYCICDTDDINIISPVFKSVKILNQWRKENMIKYDGKNRLLIIHNLTKTFKNKPIKKVKIRGGKIIMSLE